MSRSIERKISKLIKGLQVESFERLLINLSVIQQRLEQTPSMIDLLEPHISLSETFAPQGYQLSLPTSHQYYVQLWLFCLKAHLGNLRLRFTPALDLVGWSIQEVPNLWSVLSKIRWVRLEHYPEVGFTEELLIWIPSSDFVQLPTKIQRTHRWVLSVDSLPVEDAVYDSVMGLDGSASTNTHFDEWITIIQLDKLQYLSSPQDWSPSYKILLELGQELKVLDFSGVDCTEFTLENLSGLFGLNQLYLNNCCLTELPNSLRTLNQLQVLEVGFNPIQMLPNWLDELQGLRCLNVAHTKFVDCPEEVGQLPNLEILKIRAVDSALTRRWLNTFKDQPFVVHRVSSHHRLSLWRASILQL